jgi:hypothetical protein
MPPSPPHGGALSANDVTSLQAALSLSGDFVEFVSEAAIEYRFARGYNDRLSAFAGDRFGWVRRRDDALRLLNAPCR